VNSESPLQQMTQQVHL